MPRGAKRLQAALERTTAKDRREIEGELTGALVGAEVLVPADPKGEWLAARQTPAGPALFAFTDLDALEAWAGGLPRFRVRRTTELVALALDVGAAALTLDAGSQRALVLTWDGLLEVADEMARHGPTVEPPPLPPSQRLLDALRDLAGRHPEVTAAYVYGVLSSDERLARATVGLEVTDKAPAAQEDAPRSWPSICAEEGTSRCSTARPH
ncbi:MAG: SseB family protein [Egibacteraceae bacterium]